MIKNNSVNFQERDKSIDALRGLAIMLVVLGHCIQYSGIDFDKNIFFRLIYSFHMPLFMFISGYVSFFSNEKIILNFKKRSFLLLMPFLSWGMINFIKSVLIGTDQWSKAGLFLFNLLNHPDDNGLWFLWILFLISIIILIFKVFKINLELGIFCTWILLNLLFVKWNHINFMGLGLLKYHLLYFLLGLMFCKSRMNYIKQYNLIIIFCSIVFPSTVVYWYRLLPPQFILNLGFDGLITKILWLCYQYFCGILGIGLSMFLINSIKKVSKAIIENLSQIGQITLEIYAVHFHFLVIGYLILNFLEGFFYIGSVFLFVLLCTIVIIKIMKKSSLISLIFFGQIKNVNAIK